jgi:hypothetical protein
LLALFVIAGGLVSCATDDSSGGSGGSAVVEPADTDSTTAFIRVTVTPAAIDTPVPTSTSAPAAKAEFTAEQLGDPVFPDWLDPELNDEQPEDEAVFEGWQEYLTNTRVSFAGGGHAHFCDEGIIADDNGSVNEGTLWKVERTAAMSSREWGKVAFIGEITTGDFAGREYTAMVVSREGGKILQLDWTAPTEIAIARSTVCLGLAG